jgi:uncharacterized protein (UPF0332 family)
LKQSTERLLDKASRAIEAARVLLRENSSDFAAGRAYYGMFYVAEALLNESGQHFRKHSAVHAAYGEQFAKTAILDPKYHRWLLNCSDMRLLGDYEVETTLDRDDVEKMITQAKEFLEVARRYLEPGKDATSKQT